MPTGLKNLLARIRALLSPSKIQQEISDELEFHLAMRIEENVKAGMDPEEARRQALQRFGNPTALREHGWDERGGGFLEILLKDLAFGFRTLRRKPVLTTTVILALGLGIGANTAVFSVIDATLLAPLPFPQPDRLVTIWENHRIHNQMQVELAPANYLDLRRESRAFDGIAASLETRVNLTGVSEPERLSGILVSDNFFRILGVRPLIGRGFLPGEDQVGTASVVVLGHGFWERRCGSDTGIVGRSVQLDGQNVTVVGVMPEELNFPKKNVDVWMPLQMGPDQASGRGDHYIHVIGRLHAGTSLRQAQAEVDTIAETLESRYPRTNEGVGIHLAPMHDWVVSNDRTALSILFGAVGVVLLICCTNVANLLLARASERGKEMALRKALGAGRGRLIRQLLTESLLLALAGGLLGLLLGLALVRVLGNYIAEALPQASDISLDSRLLLYTLAVSMATGLLFGLVPALKSSGISLNLTLRGVEHQPASGPKANRNQKFLVISQLALCFVLLIGAALLLKSFTALVGMDPGFRPEQVCVMGVELPFSKYRVPEARWSFHDELLDKVRALPGVKSAGIISFAPLTKTGVWFSFSIEGRSFPGDMNLPQAVYRVVSPGYFPTMNIPLLQGRDFSAGDHENASPIAIVNLMMANRFWPEGAIGKRFKIGPIDSPNKWMTIAGIVADVRQSGLDAKPEPQMYVSYRQDYRAFIAPSDVVIRTAADATVLAPALRRAVWSIDKDQPVSRIETMDAVVSRSVAGPRFRTLLLGLFAVIALALAAIGVYGVISYAVAQQTREIGVHMALGADPGTIVRGVILRGLKLATAGMTIGLVFALGATRFLETLLFGVSPLDLSVFVLVSVLLMFVALAACYVPARRAARLDPASALRLE